MNCLIILSLNFCCCLPARLAISLCCKARVIEPLLPELWTLGRRLVDGEGFCTNGESTFTIAALVVACAAICGIWLMFLKLKTFLFWFCLTELYCMYGEMI